MNAIVQRPQPDWSQPVRWNTGESCTAEKVNGFVLITLDQTPKAIEQVIATKHFKDTVVVHEDDGSPVGWDSIEAWVENENAVSKGTQLWNSF